MTSSPKPESRRRRHDDYYKDKDKDKDRRRDRDRSRSPRDSRRDRDRDRDHDRSRRHDRSDKYRDKHSSKDERSAPKEVEKKRKSPSPKNEEDSALRLQEKLHSKQVLAEAQAKIQEKLKAMGKIDAIPILSEAPTHKSLRPEEASAYVGLTMNKTEQRLHELKNRIKGSNIPLLSNLNIPTPVPEKKPEVELVKEQPEVKEPEPEEDEELVVDPRLQMKRPVKGRRSTFKFVQAGEYQKLANVQRNTARLHLLQSEIETVAKQTGISSAVKLALVTPDIDQGSSKYLPSIEWWDEYLLKNKSYSAMPSKDLPPDQRYPETITNLIEHPIQLKAPDEPSQAPILKVYLTKKERKKLRRQNRRELLKEQMEKVRLGLAPPPEPKVKISNLMKVLGSDAIQDPTKMEAHVREQMANRLKKHLVSNMFVFYFLN